MPGHFGPLLRVRVVLRHLTATAFRQVTAAPFGSLAGPNAHLGTLPYVPKCAFGHTIVIPNTHLGTLPYELASADASAAADRLTEPFPDRGRERGRGNRRPDRGLLVALHLRLA